MTDRVWKPTVEFERDGWMEGYLRWPSDSLLPDGGIAAQPYAYRIDEPWKRDFTIEQATLAGERFLKEQGY